MPCLLLLGAFEGDLAIGLVHRSNLGVAGDVGQLAVSASFRAQFKSYIAQSISVVFDSDGLITFFNGGDSQKVCW